MIKVIPLKGLKVIDPSTRQALPVEGTIIRVLDTYWSARLSDGDIKVEELKASKKSEVTK